ncbi:MAG: hypothetical protein Q8L74_06210, partial [Nitrospirota bacterium]|nr:hypothetical protein [Nitrospirota bacterium]
CSRLGEFTGFERARRSWVIQEVLRRRASSRATFPGWQKRKQKRAAVLKRDRHRRRRLSQSPWAQFIFQSRLGGSWPPLTG